MVHDLGKSAIDMKGFYISILSNLLTFAVVILCATGSKTMAVPLLVLPSGLGSGGGTESEGKVILDRCKTMV